MDIDITIIGAGVIGLALAEQLSNNSKNSILVVDKNPTFGQETSSRNSEVIHSGIYYPQNTLKARLCVEGKDLLYEFLERYSIPYKRIGKIIVSTNHKELEQLERLKENGNKNGVNDLEIIDSKYIKKIEPEIKALAGLYSPSTGILDSHRLMQCLYQIALNKGCLIVFNTEVVGIKLCSNFYQIKTLDGYSFSSRIIINSAGLKSDFIASILGINDSQYKLYYCKGDYFRSKRYLKINKLIYPVPEPDGHGLGIHLTMDLTGSIRFGPDTEYIKTISYDVDRSKSKIFYQAIKKYLPNINEDDLIPDTSGIRPKLQGPNDSFRDFIISHEDKKGFKGFINLIGIESPGLTSCLAIAKYVEKIIDEIN